MARKQYFRSEIALVSLTIAVLILFMSVTIWRLAEQSRQTSSDNVEAEAPVEDFPEKDPPDGNPDSDLDQNEQYREQDEFIDLQPTVDAWLATTNRQVGLMIYDLDHGRVAASYHPDQIFNIASVYKLFYVYDGYRQLASGAEQADDYFVTTTDYRAGRYTISECLDLAVRESYNGCADALRSSPARSRRVQKLINDLTLKNTLNLGLESTASDLTILLRFYYAHEDLPKNLWQQLADSLLNQPPTEVAAGKVYDWRGGLPSGFSDRAKVYDKVGWEWNGKSWDVYADAAIVEFPAEGRHYTVAVLTRGFSDAAKIGQLGSMLENTILASSEPK